MHAGEKTRDVTCAVCFSGMCATVVACREEFRETTEVTSLEEFGGVWWGIEGTVFLA